MIIAILGAFILPPIGVGAASSSMSPAIIGGMLLANNVDNGNMVQEQSRTVHLVTVKAINGGVQNQAQGPAGQTYDTSLLRETQTTAPADYRLTTETQKAQQEEPRVNTLSESITEENFTVTTWDGMTLPAKLWTKYPNQNKPLVVLVNGVGCDLNTWPQLFSAMWNGLLDRGFTVVAYTQRYGGNIVPNFAYLIKDLRDVIYTAIELYDQHIDENNIGLVGHSLGSYVVTMAACADLSYLLGDFYSKIKVVVEGNGPDNLREAAEYMRVYVDNMRWWVNDNWDSICAAEQPIGYGKGGDYLGHPWCVADWAGQDHVDSIYIPYWVFHDQWDGVIPYRDNAYPLFEDSRYNGIHWWHCVWIFCWWDYTVVTANWNVGWLIVSDCGSHLVWLSNTAVTSALNVIDTYL